MCQQNTVFTTYMSFEKKEIFIYYVCVYIIYMCPKLEFLLGEHHCEMAGPTGIRYSQRKWYFPQKKTLKYIFIMGSLFRISLGCYSIFTFCLKNAGK